MRVTADGGGGIRLLIADDEDIFAELVEALVAPAGIEVVARARNGAEAVELARSLAPDVIVMDIGMPVMDGIEATRQILETRPRTRVVIFTGSDESRDVERAREVGAAAYVQKMHISALLLDAIRRAGEREQPSRLKRDTTGFEAAVACP